MGTVGVTVVLALAGVLFATSARIAHGTPLRADRSDLPSLISAEDARVNARLRRVREMREEIDRQTRAAATGNGALSDLQRRIDRIDEAGGLAAVRGRAIRVTLNDAPKDRPRPDDVTPDALVVHQQDVQAVVNALWLGGAEAMMLQDQRVISTSAVRCVGNTLNLQGRVYGPPYVITAIGDISRMRASLRRDPLVSVYQAYVKMYGLGWKVEALPSVTMPAFDGSIDLRYARPPQTATPAPAGGGTTSPRPGTTATGQTGTGQTGTGQTGTGTPSDPVPTSTTGVPSAGSDPDRRAPG
jgi:uncharacterized protein YlxW (UPF0749 family)